MMLSSKIAGLMNDPAAKTHVQKWLIGQIERAVPDPVRARLVRLVELNGPLALSDAEAMASAGVTNEILEGLIVQFAGNQSEAIFRLKEQRDLAAEEMAEYRASLARIEKTTSGLGVDVIIERIKEALGSLEGELARLDKEIAEFGAQA